MVLNRPDPLRPKKVVGVVVLMAIGAALGVIAAFSGRWIAEGIAGSYEVRAVITVHESETTEGRDGGKHTDWTSEALAEDGRSMRLPGDQAFGIAEPVVVRLSSLTDRVLAVRDADGELVESHDLTVKYVLMPSGAVVALLGGWLLFKTRRWHAPTLRTREATLAILLGAVLAAVLVLAPVAFGRGAFRGAATVPVQDLSQVGRRGGTPPPVVERGGTARSGDEVAMRVLGVTRGAPEGAAPWLSGFDVLTLRVEETRTTEGPFLSARLVADKHGAPNFVEYCGGAPGALANGTSAPGTHTGLLCFVVPPGFVPSYLLLGTLRERVLLTL
ncbi:hypothetical protein [Amycolatopsis sp. NPDC051071]|uniref:hypothetical protein n=1 Tax=Amycolatopsis sp. NPDC051071 TaxID=3154637 RepID=UPI003427B6F5